MKDCSPGRSCVNQTAHFASTAPLSSHVELGGSKVHLYNTRPGASPFSFIRHPQRETAKPPSADPSVLDDDKLASDLLGSSAAMSGFFSARFLGLLAAGLVAATLVSTPTVAAAQAGAPRLPNPRELAAARAVIDRGVVAVVEPSPGPNRARLLLLSGVAAPAETTYRVLAEPQRYPEFMAGMAASDVTSRRQQTLVYGWEWRMAGTSWTGVSAMAFAPPHDIAVRIMRSDLGVGHFRWHFYPRDATSCIAAESVSMDLSESHRLIRWMASRGAAMSESVILTLGIVLLEGSREQAAEVAAAGGSVSNRPVPSGDLTAEQIAGLSPLLERGAVVLLESERDGSFRRAVVFESVDAPQERVLNLLHHPERWSAAVPVISQLEITGREGSSVDAQIAMNLSIFEVEGTIRITPVDNGVQLRGTGGGLENLRLDFQTTPLPNGRTVIRGTGRARAARASFFLRQLVRANPHFERGLNSSAQLLFVRGLAAAAVAAE